MYIYKIVSQHRRDFTAIYECESCDHRYEGSGYDDDNFHNNVIPKMECPKCGKVAPVDYKARETKYVEWETV
jgi:DNA-directed RNA polymerase subunit M/transcription elongation factor TFIIS